MVKTNFTQMRWVGWASLCVMGHPEIGRLQDWANNPGQVAELIGLYFLLGLVLEAIYRKVVWGAICPVGDGATVCSTEFQHLEWKSFMDQSPPEDCPLEILCEDGRIRKGKTIARALNGRLIFEIEYEAEIRQQQRMDPMRFAPKYWRKSSDMSKEKGDRDVF